MAGRGPAPKLPSQRRNTTKPQRGEWVDLQPVTEPVPKLPRGRWSARTKAAWESWWTDRASTQWTEADRHSVVELAYLHGELAGGRVTVAAEIRQRMDGLGLTQKGKRDLRWRVAEAVEEEQGSGRPVAEVRRLRAVDPAAG